MAMTFIFLRVLIIIMAAGISTIASSQNAGLRYSNASEAKPLFSIKFTYLPVIQSLPGDAASGPLNRRQPAYEIREAPLAFTVCELPLFCKWEYKMEKAARFPVKFRLGDVREVDRLEGK